MKTICTDRLIVVNSSSLLNYLDPSDIDCRESSVILDAYHKDWFFEFHSRSYFIPPAAQIREGKLLFINGRHRSLLLHRHLLEFPFLISNLDMDYHVSSEPNSKSINTLEAIKVREFQEHDTFALPDLEFSNF